MYCEAETNKMKVPSSLDVELATNFNYGRVL
jgi:hypothetical protein